MGQARKPKGIPLCTGRYVITVSVFVLAFVAILGRAAYLQIYESNKLSIEADKRSVRVKGIDTRRGVIYDRNGIELARSIPVESLWVDPKKIIDSPSLMHSVDWKKLATVLEMKESELTRFIKERSTKRFVWLKRKLHPEQAQFIHRLSLDGVYLQQEQRRYYPTAEINSHVVGFTGIDSNGLEGLEKAFNDLLIGNPGQKKVVVDLYRNVIENKGIINDAKNGEDLVLSLDSRIQALAYRELKAAVLRHGARAGSLVILDIDTGEVLAMVNQPSYNPNRGDQRKPQLTRNRAVTDMFEPGSTAKPFTVLTSLEAKSVKPNTLISTGPGKFRVDNQWVRDGVNLGTVTVTKILQKSSNVGVAKLALALDDQTFLDTFYKLGFGLDTGSGFPGESSGRLSIRHNWSQFEKATMAYGYGFQVTPLQLAQAYAIIGSKGVKRPVSFLKVREPISEERIFSKESTEQVLQMMETVVKEGGTATGAALESYRTAGKTGTARKAIKGGYGDEYLSFFAGISPVSNPKIAMVVMLDEPEGDVYYGGDVAAPIYSNVAEQALRLLNIVPDKETLQTAHSSNTLLANNGGRKNG
ncbi:peptidoglycan D,D-transpeptidase FtsI family protein [Pleionea litopenaei]|uniref:Peptidoglycan D,D-transpeptidase FtsI n=1 Tax=Pleionea litopenaei TaxID=3070815 RepID=A0AA51RW66_9GAMM|nr:penicillin-binding transpeptidase domain-containing protein [Pleionea sp. HL-JVS1]WMS88680.1 penicillin-binding transpeptidase domain-containing protein [Pleionea sp. HL-JVS1]